MQVDGPFQRVVAGIELGLHLVDVGVDEVHLGRTLDDGVAVVRRDHAILGREGLHLVAVFRPQALERVDRNHDVQDLVDTATTIATFGPGAEQVVEHAVSIDEYDDVADAFGLVREEGAEVAGHDDATRFAFQADDFLRAFVGNSGQRQPDATRCNRCSDTQGTLHQSLLGLVSTLPVGNGYARVRVSTDEFFTDRGGAQ